MLLPRVWAEAHGRVARTWIRSAQDRRCAVNDRRTVVDGEMTTIARSAHTLH
jgi:hypothetical protein